MGTRGRMLVGSAVGRTRPSRYRVGRAYARRIGRAAWCNALSVWGCIVIDQFAAKPLSGILYRWGAASAVSGRFLLEDAPIHGYLAITIIPTSVLIAVQVVLSAVFVRCCLGMKRRALRVSTRCLLSINGWAYALLTCVGLLFLKASGNLVPGGVVFVGLFSAGVILGLWRFARREVRERAMAIVPLCRRCGYNLRGIDRVVCPECGTPFEPPVPESADASTERVSQGV
jgi:hypothetical protein